MFVCAKQSGQLSPFNLLGSNSNGHGRWGGSAGCFLSCFHGLFYFLFFILSLLVNRNPVPSDTITGKPMQPLSQTHFISEPYRWPFDWWGTLSDEHDVVSKNIPFSTTYVG